MAGGKLTDKAIKNAKPGERLTILSDGGGLQLWLTPAGGKLWNYAYRFGAKRRKLAIGPYGKEPAGIPLEAARKRRDEAAGLLREGVDPSTRKRQVKAARAEANANTFEVVADEVLAKKKREGIAAATAGKLEWLLGLAKTDLGALPIADISAGEVLRVLRPLEAAGKLETAKRLRAVIGSVFRYAIATARADNDPTQALRGAIASPKPEHRAAITDPTAFGGLLRAIDGFMGQPTTKAALQLMALLACRPGELRHASWVEFDLERRVWNVPAERTKMRRTHRIPLPTQAVAILKALHPVTGHGVAGLVFPGLRSVKRRSTCCASPVLRYPSPTAIRQKPGETAQAANVAQIHCNRCDDPWVDRPRVMFAKSTEERMQELRPPYRLQIRRGTVVGMSGIVESGRESGHGDIDANDPIQIYRRPNLCRSAQHSPSCK